MNIAEIAKMAGVSSAAVSRYFNQGYISEEKKEAIRKVVEKTGYRPSIQAQTLRTKKTKMIGVILPRINSSATSGMVEGLIGIFHENGYQILLADTMNNPEKELDYLRAFNEKQVDGVIFIATVFTKEHCKLIKKMKIPLVLLGQQLKGCSCVYHDNYNSAYDMTRLLLDRGRRNLGYLGVLKEDKAAGADRYQGYCHAVEEANLPALKEQYTICDFSIESGYEGAKHLLEHYGNLDGILCATDRIAVGAMQYLKSRHLRIPGQVMLAGHGDSILTKVVEPTITTIHYNYPDSGREAAQILLDRINGQQSEIREIMLGYTIVENQSTVL